MAVHALQGKTSGSQVKMILQENFFYLLQKAKSLIGDGRTGTKIRSMA